MTNEAATPGPLLARGRDADVYDAGAGRVLRRYRDSQRSAETEATVMRYAAERGYPVPAVHDAAGPDLVIQQLPGPTMLDDMARRPRRLRTHAAILAQLHAQLHCISPPDGLATPFGPAQALLHLDLHPANVIVTPDGPVVIDWSSVAAGPPCADLAQTWLLLETSDIPGRRLQRSVLGLARRIFLHAFLTHVDTSPVFGILPRVAETRLEDHNLLEPEATRINTILRRRRPT